ncbi:cell surface hydrolase (putative) [Pediococcus damnosus]|uniref:alpha/beta hydrolase n=1 Tax=Pediococcus damnosus TaxID=51663 RepID=UPI00078CA8E1|nr:alpha/beta hydrolase [Pediococcus damnosus]AMV69343.1 cell surface hydrolase (putative) [Pediococcus damnosus]
MLTKISKKAIIICLVIVVVVAALLGIYVHNHQPKIASKYQQTNIPTLFLHGYGSSYHAEKHMVKAVQNAHATNGVIRAEVSKTGKVTLVGHLRKNIVNPIVMINYQNNHERSYRTDGKWLRNVLQKIQQTYHFKKFNTVSHSVGNEAVMYYMADFAPQNKGLPQLNKEVNIAGHFAGIRGYDAIKGNTLNAQGKPRHMIPTYQALLKLRKTYPQNGAVLNIYGNIGDRSDGTVQNYSSKSLRYLVQDRAKSYQELEMKGKLAQHSKLHANPKVDHAILKFLWEK